MRIGINGRFLVARRTGVQRAAYNLIRTLVEIDKDNEYVIFTGNDQIDRPEWQRPNVRIIGSTLREGESFRNHLWEQFVLPRLAQRYEVDLLHSPANIAPLFFKGLNVVHIHDLCFAVNPQWYSFSFRTLYNLVIPRLARRATMVITNSNNSRNDLLQFVGVPAEKVNLVYWAVDDVFVRQSPDEEPAEAEDSDRPSDYILYVGSLAPRKNIKVLVEAYQELRRQHPDLKTKLVLIGGESPLFAQVRLNLHDFGDDVIFKGFVNDHQLRSYYRHASLVAYPSLYEGFGLPPLEAMASGTPVVTSVTSSIPEVVGDAALMVNPHDPRQLVEAMVRLLKDERLRETMIKRGYEQVAQFNWYRVARSTLGVYYEVVQHKNAHQRGAHYMPRDVWQRLRKLEIEKFPPRRNYA